MLSVYIIRFDECTPYILNFVLEFEMVRVISKDAKENFKRLIIFAITYFSSHYSLQTLHAYGLNVLSNIHCKTWGFILTILEFHNGGWQGIRSQF